MTNPRKPQLVHLSARSTIPFATGGLVDAAEFAENLVQAASEWKSGCGRTLAATQLDDPCTTMTSRHEDRRAR
jgi:hypothetical protein